MLKFQYTGWCTGCEELTHWKRPWCWERLRAGGEVGDKDEIVGWHHRLNGHEFDQTPGDSEGQESLVCCSPWGRKESDMTEWLDWLTNAEAEAPVLWPPDLKNWLIGKDPDAGKDWRQEEKGMTEDKIVGWHHRLNGHEFEQAPEVGDGQGSLACCSPWGHKESDTTAWLNWTELTND